MVTKRILILASLLILLALRGHGAAEEPHKAVFNIFTYKGTQPPANGYGFFIGADGTGIASYSLFRDADRAEIIDARGNKYPVVRILGASSQYDLVKFRADCRRTTEFLRPATQPTSAGGTLQLINYSASKKALPTGVKVEKASPYGSYKYYDVSVANNERNFGCPLLNSQGEVVAIVQKTMSPSAKNASAIDARFTDTLRIRSTGAFSSDLRSIKIPKALPDNIQDALAFIYMMNQDESREAIAAYDDFIQTYPDNAEGYVNRATYYGSHGNYPLCEADFETALRQATHPSSTITEDGIRHAYSRLIYNQLTAKPAPTTCPWTLDQALQQALTAYDINPNPLYLLQAGHCYYAKQDYEAAFQAYKRVNQTDFATPETFLSAAQALEQGGADPLQVLEQLDSAITRLDKPYNVQGAQYLYVHALQAIKCERFREAALDLIEYEKVITPNRLSHQFYYDREQTERRAKMYQQALDDIRTAEARSERPQYYLYLLEESSLLLQVGMYDEAIATSEALLKELPDNPDAYKIMGLAYGEKKQKAKAREMLEKAAQLGDPDADALTQKYQ